MTASTIKNRNPRRKGRAPITMSAAELEALSVLSIAEVAVFLRIAEDTVRAEIKAGNLHAENYGSRGRPVYRISREALNRWRESRSVVPKEHK